MGSCLSKKSTIPPPLPIPPSALPNPPPDQVNSGEPETQMEKQQQLQDETVKKEIFVIKHRKSHDTDTRPKEEKGAVEEIPAAAEAERSKGDYSNSCNEVVVNTGLSNGGGIMVRTSSCTKEEVDAILIQCGRLSRSSSIGTGKAGISSSSGKKYSGSKRSYDFDNEAGDKKGNLDEDKICGDENVDGEEGEAVGQRSHRHRQRQRESRGSSPSSSSHGRRRTPSREREQQQRSGSRERSSGSGGRRVSRSPGRRSESPITTSNAAGGAIPLVNSSGSGGARPGKMVSVPATVSSLAMDRSNNADAPSAAAIKKIQVKRNAGEVAAGSRNVASPRARSPARTNVRVFNDNQNAQFNNQQPVSLSRSNSRKAEQSPYRRTPLSDIDNNAVGFEQQSLPGNRATNNNTQSQAPLHKPNVENASSNILVQGIDNKISSGKGNLANNVATVNCRGKEQQQQLKEEDAKGLHHVAPNVAVNVVPSGAEGLKPQALTRSRSSRRSRDLDINPEGLSNPSQSYTALLLEDIQNFHQKTTTPSVSLPPCLTKACSILEAVADLNSSTSSNLSCAFAEDRYRIPSTEPLYKNDDDSSSIGSNQAGKKRSDAKDPVLESEVLVDNELMEPSFHKYVTVRRGTVGGGRDMEEQESSGSNSFVGVPSHWVSSSSWDPNSADSTECWSSSRSNVKEDESGHDAEELQRRVGTKKRECNHEQTGIGRGRGRIGSRRILHTMATAATS